jgi:hypothetical protein
MVAAPHYDATDQYFSFNPRADYLWLDCSQSLIRALWAASRLLA